MTTTQSNEKHGAHDHGDTTYRAVAETSGSFVAVARPQKTHAHHEHSCCAAPAAAASTPASTVPLPVDVTSTRYRIINMDCPVEERLIRNRVGPMAGIARLDFDLMSRVLTVHRNVPETSDIAAALTSIGMQGELLADDASHDTPVVQKPHSPARKKRCSDSLVLRRLPVRCWLGRRTLIPPCSSSCWPGFRLPPVACRLLKRAGLRCAT
jgi:hypothetical protein